MINDNLKQEEQFDFSVFENTGKYNTTIKITEEDHKAGLKILCKESYAQDLYNAMKKYEKSTSIKIHAVKDLILGEIYSVTAKQISFENRIITAHENNSGTRIDIPFREFSREIESLTRGEGIEFKVMITKSTNSNEFIGSEKKCLSVNHRAELNQHLENDTWFEVKIVKLIKGGYLAKYKDSIECFIPGSHAAANIIRDFDKLIGKTINVMVDNYDASNDLYILSYKKYIQHSMQYMISELEFGKQYTGILTNNPYDFGIFVEFEDYFTGLIHSTEFENYENIKRTLKSGDEINFYVKNVTRKGKQYRIVLTLDPNTIDFEKKQWSDFRNRIENKVFDYDVESNSNSIKIHIDDELYEVTLKRTDLDRNLSLYPRVKVLKVDPINKNLKFEFVEKLD